MQSDSTDFPALRGVDTRSDGSTPKSPPAFARIRRGATVSSEEVESHLTGIAIDFRRAILQSTVSRETIAPMESALLNHPTIAFPLFREMFEDCGDELRPCVQKIYESLTMPQGRPAFELLQARQIADRWLSIVQTICPDAVAPQLGAA